jgi:hypothetical protein
MLTEAVPPVTSPRVIAAIDDTYIKVVRARLTRDQLRPLDE